MKKMRHKLIFTVFIAISCVFLTALVILYGALHLYYAYQADNMTQIISLSGGVVPELQEYKNQEYANEIPYQSILNEESEFRTRYFIVYLTDEAQLISTNIEHIASVSEEDAFEMAKSVAHSGKTTGFLEEYRFLVTEGDDINTIIFLDCSENFQYRKVVLMIVFTIAVIITVLVTLIFGFLSKRVVKPFEENAKRQKQFITDASHELKTPLSIISANAEVLQYKNGGNEWTQNIVAQTKRMSDLISDLLTLSKMEEVETEITMESVDLSKLTADTIEPFREVASQKQVEMHTEIANHVYIKGNAEQLRQMLSLLTENATKYVSQNGTILVSLHSSGRRIVLKISNTAQLAEDFDYNRLFDRFYRPDSSRSSETGGHGIGLSIAKNIVLQHNGTLTAEKTSDGICFTAQFRN